jgi:opine dehydrogenase
MTDGSTETVAIIGAGIGGLYLVAELGIAGFKLRLHDIDDSRLSEIRARGGVDVDGERGGFAPVERATTDLDAAVDGADVIIMVTGGNAQATVARSLAPLLGNGQVILLIQGNTGGSLMVRRALDDAGCGAEVDVAEMDNYPYSCWRVSPTQIRPIVKKRWLQIATFPGNRIGAVFPRLSSLFRKQLRRRISCTRDLPTRTRCCTWPIASPMRDVSRAGTAINSTPRVSPLRPRGYTRQSMPSVSLSLQRWGPQSRPCPIGSIVSTACARRHSLRPVSLTYNSDGPYQATGTPKSLDHKFITEDVPTGLIPMSALGVAAGVRTRAIDALIEMTRCMTGKDFAADARTLERLGLSGMDGLQIHRVVEEGFS